MHEYWDVHDKTGWGDGPWLDEPDKRQWVDPVSDLDCLMVRNSHLGNWCGYVGVPPGHPWHFLGDEEPTCDESCEDRKDWIDGRCVTHEPGGQVEVHGGLTFAGECREHEDPAQGICHIPEPGRPEDVWWFGFDCAHGEDHMPGSHIPFDGATYKDARYVAEETERLARQLAGVTASG